MTTFWKQFNGKLLEGGFRVTTRKMMGEYILYADGKIFGGIYDDRLLVKPMPAAVAMLPGAKKQLPYEGAKPMLRVTNEQIADSKFLAKLLDAMLPELPAPQSHQRRSDVILEARRVEECQPRALLVIPATCGERRRTKAGILKNNPDERTEFADNLRSFSSALIYLHEYGG